MNKTNTKNPTSATKRSPKNKSHPKITGIVDMVLERDVVNVAFHEVGHYIIAQHFELSANIRLWRTEASDPFTLKTIWGQCQYDRSTAFRKCCIGWAGPVSEILLDCGSDCRSGEDLFSEFLDAWDEEDCSATDRAAINSHVQKWRALKLVTKVLFAQRHHVYKIVEMAKQRLVTERKCEFTWNGKPNSPEGA